MTAEPTPPTHVPKRQKRPGVFVAHALIESPASRALSGTALRVLLIFHQKRQLEPVLFAGRTEWRVVNNGRIVFTYREASTKHGVPASNFRRALDQLIEHGFIDVARPGQPIARAETLYAMSDRWRRFGLPGFLKQTRPKETRRYGAQRGTATDSSAAAPKSPLRGGVYRMRSEVNVGKVARNVQK